MNPVVIGNAAWNAILGVLTGMSGLWNGAKIHLYQNNLQPTPANVLADFTEATFTGYAESAAVTWGTPGYLPNGTAIVTGDAKTFAVGSSPTIFNTIYGWYATNTGGSTLLIARALDVPVVLNGALQQLVILPAYPAYVSQ